MTTAIYTTLNETKYKTAQVSRCWYMGAGVLITCGRPMSKTRCITKLPVRRSTPRGTKFSFGTWVDKRKKKQKISTHSHQQKRINNQTFRAESLARGTAESFRKVSWIPTTRSSNVSPRKDYFQKALSVRANFDHTLLTMRYSRVQKQLLRSITILVIVSDQPVVPRSRSSTNQEEPNQSERQNNAFGAKKKRRDPYRETPPH